MMLLPIAPFPPPSLHHTIPPSAYESWTHALALHLQLPLPKFASSSLQDPALLSFLTTYLTTVATTTPSPSSTPLKRKVLTLLHRILTLPDTAPLPPSLTSTPFLRSLATAFPRRTGVLARTLDEARAWRRFEPSAERLKRVVVAARGVAPGGEGLVPLLRFSGRLAELFLAGDEWVEVAEVGEFKVAVLSVVAERGTGRKPNWSLVTDTLYGLIAAAAARAGKGGREERFLKALVGTTGLVAGLRRCAGGTAEEGRVEAVVKELAKFGRPRAVRKDKSKGTGKGKGKEKVVGPSEDEELAVMRKVADIRDIFPTLGSGFLRRCLAALDSDVERVTRALLEDDLPRGLQHADRTEEHIPIDTPAPAPTPAPTPTPTTRHNRYNNDALSTLSPSALARVHIGHKNTPLPAPDRGSKAAILAALAAFDSADDERDDTYDVADVGTTTFDDPDPDADTPDVDRVLWAALQSDPAVFARDAETRRGAPRAAVREATGYSDEAVEGWRVMLEREPGRAAALLRRFGEAPRVEVLERTSWREGEREGGADAARGRGRGRGRGSGSGTGRGGATGPEATQKERARKEAGKGGRANHNRRDQRARKMARGGFPPAA